jgi:hypothetical protein
MKRISLLLILLLAFACASSNSQTGKTAKPDPPIEIEQLVGPAELNYPYGPIEVQYQLVVQNPTPQPITLTRVAVATLNSQGAAYTLRRDFYNVKKTIAPNATDSVTFWAKAFSYGRSMRDTEPITLRAIVYFDSPEGSFQKIFIRELPQYGQ